MMTLYLMRHGAAVERGAPGFDCDRERPLTAKGEERIRHVAEALDQMEIAFDAVLSSPLIRAQQTASTLMDELKLKLPLLQTEHLAPGADPKGLIEFLQEQPGSPNTL